MNFTLRQAIGVVGCISPWIYHCTYLLGKLLQPLPAGNTVVAKPSEVTPMTAFY